MTDYVEVKVEDFYVEVNVENRTYSNSIIAEVNSSAIPNTTTSKINFSSLAYHDRHRAALHRHSDGERAARTPPSPLTTTSK